MHHPKVLLSFKNLFLLYKILHSLPGKTAYVPIFFLQFQHQMLGKDPEYLPVPFLCNNSNEISYDGVIIIHTSTISAGSAFDAIIHKPFL